MALIRDPFMRELLLDDYDRRYNRPWRYCFEHPLRVQRFEQPVRVHRLNEWPTSSSFDQALNELQNVMDNVTDAIGHYQNNLLKDTSVGGMRTQRKEDGTLQLAIDVSQYKPEEINVKLCDDNLVVEAKTESSENDNYHKSEFKRWIKLPQDVKHDAIKSTLTADKKLLVEVPCNKPIQADRSRNIPIEVQKPEAVEAGDKQQKQNGQPQAKEAQKK